MRRSRLSGSSGDPLHILVALTAAALVTACATNPVTGRPQLVLVSESQEIAMGKQYAPQVANSMGLYDDDALQRYVEELGLPMARRSERPDLPWQFRVVDDPAVNAFAVPGGFIYVTRGILAHMNSEAELVSVLGHEIGHVTARHSVSQISRQQLTQIGLGVGAVLLPPELRGLAQVASVGAQLVFLKYGRDDERQADELGFRYMTDAGYDPEAMVSMFATLGRVSGDAGQRVPDWMSTHPAPEDREARIRAAIAAAPRNPSDARRARAEFLEATNGIVYGPNPRAGFFDGTRFHHPDLAFRIDFPDGWATANQPQAVLATPPEKNAAIQLTLAPAASAEEAARNFLRENQQNMQFEGGGFQRATLSGLPAAATQFRVQTQQGTIDGSIVFVEHAERVFQIVGFAPTQIYPERAEEMRAALFSFERERDRRVLAAEAWRLRLVTPGRTLTIEDFARTHPGPISAEELARINGKDPGDVYSAGVPAKRIVGRAFTASPDR